MVEIGVSSGGSLEMWRTHLGAEAHIHGIDIEEACRVYEADRIRSQSVTRRTRSSGTVSA